ncbi:MAG TPA: hypothetical protein VKZ53_23830 [Candidatus Angelobacter sp.]|nr:hypothetical protein [Candidatus Angelobacter sp.]
MDDELLLKAIDSIYERTSKYDKKPRWQILIESSGCAALITVLFGGILGGVITARYQSHQADLERVRSREQQVEQLKFDAERKAFDLIFATVGAAEDVINLSSREMKRAPSIQRNNIRKAYNMADAEWRKRQAVTGLPMVYYATDSRAATAAWQTASKSVTAYSACAANWIVAHPFYSEGMNAGCVDERKKVDDSVSALQTQILRIS